MKSFAQSLLGLWQQLGINQRVSLVLAALVVVAGLTGIVIWSQQPDYQLLYGRLSEKDSAQIISQLQTQGIPHKISNGGSTVYVPTAHVYKLRMDLAAKGVPTGDGVGYEIFDKAQFGLSDFVQRTNFSRAIQGELGRTIAQLDGVQSARVMIVQPENRLLITDQNLKPTASVFVELSSARLESEAVNSIRYLVANSVQGLQPDQVAVIDQKGRVLSEDLRQDPALASASSQMRYRQQVEDYLAKKVETMLLPVLGAGQSVVRVSAEIETEATTVAQERYDPDGAVVRTQTATEDVTSSVEQKIGGATGVTANTPDKAGADGEQARPGTASESNRKNRTTTYEINRTLTNITRQAGSIKAVTAAVFIAQRSTPAVPATTTAPAVPAAVKTRTPEEMTALRQIVINALGVKVAPGQSLDSLVSLQEVPFQVEPVAATLAELQQQDKVQGWLDTGVKLLPVALGVVALGVFWRMLGRQKLEPVPIELLNVTPAAELAKALPAPTVLTPEILNQLIQQKPANVGTALRDWMAMKKT